MRLAVVGGLEAIFRIKSGAVVFHDDLAAGTRPAGGDSDAQRRGIRIHAVLDGVLRDGLQGQRRQTEIDVRRIVVDEEHVVKLSLLAGSKIYRNRFIKL